MNVLLAVTASSMLLVGGCATTTSEWAISDTNAPRVVVLQSQSGGNWAKAQQTALKACESKGYGLAIALDGPHSCSSTTATECNTKQVTAAFSCAAYMPAPRPIAGSF